MGRTENAEFTVLCLIEDGSRVLLQDRVKADWKGYTLPGGHVEKGESFVEAVIREMKEETGLEVGMLAPIGVFSDPARDPRGRVVSETFLTTLISTDERPLSIKAGDDAKEIALFRLKGSFSQVDGSLSVKLYCPKNKLTIEFKATFYRDRFGLVRAKIEYDSEAKLAFDHGEMVARAILRVPDLVIPTPERKVEETEEAKKQLAEHLAK